MQVDTQTRESASDARNSAALALAALAGVELPLADGGRPQNNDKDPADNTYLSASSSDNSEEEPNLQSVFFGEAGSDEPQTAVGENRYQRRFRFAWAEIAKLEGDEVAVGSRLDKITWKVVKSVEDDEIGSDGYCGVKPQFDFHKKTVAEAFLLLWPGEMWAQYKQMVRKVREEVNPQ